MRSLNLVKLHDSVLEQALKECFESVPWVGAFFQSEHHGFKHGIVVKDRSVDLIKNLSESEREEFVGDGLSINPAQPLIAATVATKLAALFHDSGRFNEFGLVVPSEQNNHQVISSIRAKQFATYFNLAEYDPLMTSAILSHDYQSPTLTPHLNPPSSLVGKIVQASDQMGWFHPNSVYRTLAYNQEIGVPFYVGDTSLQDRLKWIPSGSSPDVVTVLLFQLFSPKTSERFGIVAAQKKVLSYSAKLKENIVGLATDFGCGKKVLDLIKIYEKYYST
ncbi:hypothetical protein HN587_04410 [Candidatus Woesearchaeota archaeon]|jgi:hypothetical protein|nr:hypothetical protein [Candidatus Woesearchaeota archaeon]